jgi:hypothetical protein
MVKINFLGGSGLVPVVQQSRHCATFYSGFIDATINFDPLPQLPATPTILKSSVQNSDFFDCR